MEKFEQFWLLYPRRDGENPKHPARLVFERLVKAGIDPQVIIDAVERFRMEMQRKRMVDTRFIPHARTWLNQHRFEGHAPGKSDPLKIGETVGSGKRRYRWDGSDFKHDPEIGSI